MVLEVQDLHIDFHTKNNQIIKAVEGVSFNVNESETLSIVGESGCGKSVTALSIMRLLDDNSSKVKGAIKFKGNNLLTYTEKKMNKVRGSAISMIFQEPMTSLNPLHKIGDQVVEVIMQHKKISKKEATQHVLELFNLIGISDSKNRLISYPFQLSGGLRQRIMIAMAMACDPSLLIADEPTTALDVTIQAQILEKMKDLKRQFKTSIIFITHDLGVVAEISDRVLVMYAGNAIEEGLVKDIFMSPKHPYTEGLLKSIPQMTGQRKCKLFSIEGTVPNPISKPKRGCPFQPRCIKAFNLCSIEKPNLITLNNNHKVACLLYKQQ